MIELPEKPAPRGVAPRLIDFSTTQRSAGGGVTEVILRPGTRWAADFSFPPMRPDLRRVFTARLVRAKAEGLRLAWPLGQVRQGNPGTPVVDGTGAMGTALPLRGLNPGYAAKEGYWLSLTDGDGLSYLHQVQALAVADNAGEATLAVWPPLRGEFADGDAVNLVAPVLEGILTGDMGWELPLGDRVPLSFTLEERA